MWDDENSQAATKDAFEPLHFIARKPHQVFSHPWIGKNPAASLDLKTRCEIICSDRMPKKTAADTKKLTRQQARDLDIEIGFLEGVVRRDPKYIEALQVLGDDYTKRGRFVDGLAVDQQLARLRPSDSLVHYNLACSYSLTNCIDLAAQALERALSLGYRDFKWMAQDPDLLNLRQHPIYRKIRAKVRTIRIKVD